MSGETRLLLTVAGISGIALFTLARFRFPAMERPPNPAPAPLERLAARATFDELASIIAQLQARVSPALVILRVGSTLPATAPAPPPLLEASAGREAVRLVPAVRLRADLAVAHLAPGDRIVGAIGVVGAVDLLNADPVREIGIVRVPAGEDPSAIWAPHAPPANAQYIAIAEATPGGPALRPLFVGRTDPFEDIRWRRPLLALGGAGVTQPGALAFSLDGVLVGLTILEDGVPALVPGDALAATADQLEHSRTAPPGELGLEVNDLTPTLAAASAADNGAIVTFVRSDGPAARQLTVGDVIVTFNGAPVETAEQLLVEISRTPPGTAVTLGVLRARTTISVSLITGAPPAGGVPAHREAGWVLRTADQVGSEVLRVASVSPAHDAGLLPGDVITAYAGVQAPTPATLENAFDTAPTGDYLLLGVSRRGEHLVLALRKP